jgi:hypothetical protein
LEDILRNRIKAINLFFYPVSSLPISFAIMLQLTVLIQSLLLHQATMLLFFLTKHLPRHAHFILYAQTISAFNKVMRMDQFSK